MLASVIALGLAPIARADVEGDMGLGARASLSLEAGYPPYGHELSADISPLTKAGMLGIAVRPDTSHYFDLHHSPADTIDKIAPFHLERNAAAMALMAYILAERELPEPAPVESAPAQPSE